MRWGGNSAGASVPHVSRPGSHNLWKQSLHVKLLADRLHLVAQPLVFLELVGDLLDGVQGRRVVASAESLTDRRKGGWRLFAHQVHRHLAGEHDVLVTSFSLHVIEGDVVVVGNEGLYPVDVDRFSRAGRDDVGQEPRGFFFVDLPWCTAAKAWILVNA